MVCPTPLGFPAPYDFCEPVPIVPERPRIRASRSRSVQPFGAHSSTFCSSSWLLKEVSSKFLRFTGLQPAEQLQTFPFGASAHLDFEWNRFIRVWLCSDWFSGNVLSAVKRARAKATVFPSSPLDRGSIFNKERSDRHLFSITLSSAKLISGHSEINLHNDASREKPKSNFALPDQTARATE